jgi:hypothetical protein
LHRAGVGIGPERARPVVLRLAMGPCCAGGQAARAGEWAKHCMRESAAEHGQQGHTQDRFATEGVSQTYPILARGTSLGSGVALRQPAPMSFF